MEVKLREVKLNISYEDYIGPAILWASEDAKSLAEALDVKRVMISGGFIMGLFGGERRSGIDRYAGLVVSHLKPVEGGLLLRLYNTDKEYLVPSDLTKRYGVDIYKTYYRREINPFNCSTLNLILSSYGEEELREFIRELISVNKKAMTEADERRLRKLSEELRAQVNTLYGSHYVIYRSKRVFTACVPKDLSKVVSNFHTSYLECKSAEQAYFYAAILNYMAYRVIKKRRRFVRDQYAKPLVAIVTARLTWKDLPSQLRDEIAKLSYTLSKKLSWEKYPNRKAAVLKIADIPEFTQIRELLDKHVDSEGKQEMLERALDYVSERVRQLSNGFRAQVPTPMSKILHDST